MAMSEFEREEILAQRSEQMQRIQDKRNLERMVKDQSARAAEVDSVSKAAKRLSCLCLVLTFADAHDRNRSAYCSRRHERENSQTGRAQGKTESEG
jgi:hypothetical protein